MENPESLLIRLTQLQAEVAALKEEREELLASKRSLQDRLTQSATRFRETEEHLIEHLPIGAIIVQGDALFPNLKAEQITGYRRGELPGRDAWLRAAFPRPASTSMSTGARMRLSDHQQATPLVLVTKDGQERLVEFMILMHGAMEVWLLRDLTDSDRQARLMERTERAARIGGWEMDIRTRAVHWTSEMYRLHEVRPETYTPTAGSALAFVAPESAAVMSEALRRAIDLGEAYDVEVELVTAAGRRLPARSIGSVQMEGGKAVKLEGSFQDISDRRRAETERDQFFNLSLDLLCIADLDGRFRRVNPAFEETLGYTNEELLSLSILDLVHPEDRDATAKVMQNLGRGIDALFFEHRSQRKDGTYRWISWVIPAPRGGTERLFASARDVTQQKATEAELIAAREAALQATQAKSRFLANMSHEIRTPMNGVLGMASLLMETELSARQREYVEIIRGSGDSLLTIVNEILDFSKIESGKLTLELQGFDVYQCVEEALDLVSHQAAARQIGLAYWLDSGVPSRVVGDVTRLRQVLVNLLGNAVKFTEAGDVTVSVSCLRFSDEAVELLFCVRDSGIGIAAELLPVLFEPFTQLDASTTRRYGGTGLGLAICKRLCDAMGGWISAESEIGVGTTMRFVVTAQASDEPAQSVAGLGLEARRALQGRRVLVVDRSEGVRLAVGAQVRRLEASAVSFESPLEAAAWLRGGGRVDAVFLDTAVPEGDAAVLTAELRAQPGARAPALILLEPIGHRGVERDLAGVAGVVTKPPKRQQVESTLRQALSAEAETSSRAPRTGGLLADRHPAHVLLADDNVINQRVAALTLEKLGYRPDVVANGLEAIDALRRQAYDVVLMDMHMPELDGLEATRRIRGRWAAQRPYIIAMTAAARAQDRAACQEAGMDDYITKPFRVEELRAALLRAFAARRAESAALPCDGPDLQ